MGPHGVLIDGLVGWREIFGGATKFFPQGRPPRRTRRPLCGPDTVGARLGSSYAVVTFPYPNTTPPPRHAPSDSHPPETDTPTRGRTPGRPTSPVGVQPPRLPRPPVGMTQGALCRRCYSTQNRSLSLRNKLSSLRVTGA